MFWNPVFKRLNHLSVVYFDQQMNAGTWSKPIKNALKLLKTYFFHHAHVWLTYEYEQKLTFLAFRSDSQLLVDTQKLVAPEIFQLKSINLFGF